MHARYDSLSLDSDEVAAFNVSGQLVIAGVPLDYAVPLRPANFAKYVGALVFLAESAVKLYFFGSRFESSPWLLIGS
jgi:hypothetical protein